jgi:hypothetical protein
MSSLYYVIVIGHFLNMLNMIDLARTFCKDKEVFFLLLSCWFYNVYVVAFGKETWPQFPSWSFIKLFGIFKGTCHGFIIELSHFLFGWFCALISYHLSLITVFSSIWKGRTCCWSLLVSAAKCLKSFLQFSVKRIDLVCHWEAVTGR